MITVIEVHSGTGKLLMGSHYYLAPVITQTHRFVVTVWFDSFYVRDSTMMAI